MDELTAISTGDLAQYAEEINSFRKGNSEAKPPALANRDFTDVDLENKSLRNASYDLTFELAEFPGGKFDGMNFRMKAGRADAEIKIGYGSGDYTELDEQVPERSANFVGGDFTGASFKDANLKGVRAVGYSGSRGATTTKFVNADFAGADMADMYMDKNTDVTGAKLGNARSLTAEQVKNVDITVAATLPEELEGELKRQMTVKSALAEAAKPKGLKAMFGKMFGGAKEEPAEDPKMPEIIRAKDGVRPAALHPEVLEYAAKIGKEIEAAADNPAISKAPQSRATGRSGPG